MLDVIIKEQELCVLDDLSSVINSTEDIPALKEACETDYWLRLLQETDYLSAVEFQSIYSDCQELERLLVSIVKKSKK